MFLFLLSCLCLQYVLMFITVMVNIKIWLMGKMMNFSYSKGKEPGVCIPRVIAVPYLKFHCDAEKLSRVCGLGTTVLEPNWWYWGPQPCTCSPLELFCSVLTTACPRLAAPGRHLSLAPAEAVNKTLIQKQICICKAASWNEEAASASTKIRLSPQTLWKGKSCRTCEWDLWTEKGDLVNSGTIRMISV